MKTTKSKVRLLRAIMYSVIVLALVLVLGLSVSPAFAASTAQGTSSKPFWKVASIIFIVIDVIEVALIVILILYLRKLKKRRKLLSQLNVFVLPFLALGMGFGIGSIIFGVIGFAAIAEMSFLVAQERNTPIERNDKNASKPDEVYDYAKDEEQEALHEKTVEEWYAEEKPVCEDLKSRDEDVVYHLDTEISKESMWVNEGQGYPNRVTALKMLLEEYKPQEEEAPVEETPVEPEPIVEPEPEEEHVKTVEEWYAEEKEICEGLTVVTPLEYVDTEIETESEKVNEGLGYPNRVTALKMLHDEYYVEAEPEPKPEPEPEPEPVLTVQDWYEIEKPICEGLQYVEPLEYIDKEAEVEQAKVDEGEGYPNRVEALHILHDEYYVPYVKTVEEWYLEEKAFCETLDKDQMQPMDYVVQEIETESEKVKEGTGFENRVTALKILKLDLMTVEDWYAIEKPICLKEQDKGKDPVKYITTQLRTENKKISKGEGHENRSKALEILYDEFYVKTVEEWYHEEKVICDGLTETDPIEYLNKELASEREKVANNEGYPNRVTAIELLIEDILEERAEAEAEAKRLSDEEEAKIREQEILAARAAYVESKKRGEEAVVPVLGFLLSREDILDYVDHMVGKKYPVPATIRRRKKNYMSDGLRCGAWTFGLVYEREGVVKLIAPMEDEYAQQLQEIHTNVNPSGFPKNGNWYSLIFDSSYASKEEVYEILEYLYNYVLNKYYTYDKKLRAWVTDESAANAEIEEIDNEAQTYDKEKDEAMEVAIQEHNQALEQYNEKYKLPFSTSREKIQKYVKRVHFDSELITREDKPHRPSTLKLMANNKAYMLLYEKDGHVWMIVRCYDKYAKMLQRYHPLTTRARFPRPHNWYVVHIDGTYKTSGAIYKVIKNAKKYAIDGVPKEVVAPRKKKAAQPKKATKKSAKKAAPKKQEAKQSAE